MNHPNLVRGYTVHIVSEPEAALSSWSDSVFRFDTAEEAKAFYNDTAWIRLNYSWRKGGDEPYLQTVIVTYNDSQQQCKMGYQMFTISDSELVDVCAQRGWNLSNVQELRVTEKLNSNHPWRD
jgi:hypothetical protein